MIRILLLLCLSSLVSCKSDREVSPFKTPRAFKVEQQAERSERDSVEVFVLEKKVPGGPDKLIVRHLRKQVDKKGNGKIGADLCFCRGKDTLLTYPVELEFSENEGYWGVIENYFGDDKLSDPHFIAVSNGYDACGYPQAHFVFYIDTGKVTFFDRFESVFDADVYASYINLEPKVASGRIVALAGRYEEHELLDEAADTVLRYQVAFRDSVSYSLKNGTWIRKRLTPEGKVYRKAITTE